MLNKNPNRFVILYGWFLDKLGVVPGAEFRVAYEEAMKYGGTVILGDRSFHLKEDDVDSLTPLVVKMLKDMDVDTLNLLIHEMSKHVPTLVEALIHERDQERYMSAILLEVAREHNSVVAVVGKGHLAGIRKNWKQPVEMERLIRMPPERDTVRMGKILSCIGATVAGVAIISGIYLSIKK